MQREQRRKSLEDIGAASPSGNGFARPERIFAELRQVLSSDATVIVDGDGLDDLAQVTLSASHYLDSKASGCQGIAIPFANAAALALPGCPVVAICDAAAFSRFASELETAVRHECRVVVVVVNSGRSKVERSGSLVGDSQPTQIAEAEYPNLAAVGRAFGLYAERVVEQGDLASALDRAFSRAPALVDVCVT
jgi:acetolactate synthase-1/2/3 large subunit